MEGAAETQLELGTLPLGATAADSDPFSQPHHYSSPPRPFHGVSDADRDEIENLLIDFIKRQFRSK